MANDLNTVLYVIENLKQEMERTQAIMMLSMRTVSNADDAIRTHVGVANAQRVLRSLGALKGNLQDLPSQYSLVLKDLDSLATKLRSAGH